jgi:NADH-quinone oxidoreductase subunit J
MDKMFYFLAFLAILSAFGVVITKDPVKSVLYLLITFMCITGHYVLLNAQFLAIVNFIVYMGAIMVLFLFVIMFLNLNGETEPQKSVFLKLAGVISGGLLMLVLIASYSKAVKMPVETDLDNQIGLIKNLGLVLFTEYTLPFEIVSILFLVAMIGAVMLAKKDWK